ncbi:MAG: hypothetical protein PF572_01440 [Patescibacteria group bacterium]|jgi:UDPglucose 6-dehydrogenase|nr:hypothetical protein [Patescibacteria group bacterium]
MKRRIGFIGQGWIGKHYADDFENRGYDVVRYSLEEPYINNKEEIKYCDIVLIAVPTPSKPEGFDSSILRGAVKIVGKGKVAVIKSTLLPGVTEEIQAENPDIYVVHSPEFLREANAAFDVANPVRNIVGIPVDNEEYRKHAEIIFEVLPEAPFKLVCHSREAELIKYGGNVHLYIKVVFMNMLHDLATSHDLNWDTIKEAMAADSRIGSSHMDPVHQSGRGAGGHCFIKDFAAFKEQYEEAVGDSQGLDVLNALQNKNNRLLKDSNKDLDLLESVFGGIDNI